MWTLYSQCVCNTFCRDNREEKHLLSACLFQISYHRLKGFLLWYHGLVCQGIGLLLSYPVPRINSNFHFGKRLARMSARTQTEERLCSKIKINCSRYKYRKAFI